MTKPKDIAALFNRVDQEFGRVDILVNAAFTPSRSRPEDLPLDVWEKVLQVNLTGYFLCAQEAGRRMIKQGWGGSIINISSIGGALALGRGNFAYSVSKGAIIQLTRGSLWSGQPTRFASTQFCPVSFGPLPCKH